MTAKRTNRPNEARVYQDPKGAWRWSLEGSNGEKMAREAEGNGYTRYEDCCAAMRRVALAFQEGPLRYVYDPPRDKVVRVLKMRGTVKVATRKASGKPGKFRKVAKKQAKA